MDLFEYLRADARVVARAWRARRSVPCRSGG